jgi:hypothetical protein
VFHEYIFDQNCYAAQAKYEKLNVDLFKTMKKAVSSKENASRSKPVKAAPTLYLKTKYQVSQRSAFVHGHILVQNDLPEPPFDCKFVSCPFVDLSRFAEYKQTTLETKWNHELLTEADLGVHVDLIDPDTYRIHDALEVDSDGV